MDRKHTNLSKELPRLILATNNPIKSFNISLFQAFKSKKIKKKQAVPVFVDFWTDVSNASISANTATDSRAVVGPRVDPLPIGILLLSVPRPPPDDFRLVSIADEMAAALPA